MTPRYGLRLAGTVLVLAIAAAGFAGLHAQITRPAYVIIDIGEMKDADAYVKAVSASEPHATVSTGGRFVVRTNAPIALDGTPPNRFVVIAFDSTDKARAWYDTPAIKEINAVRLKTATSRAFIVEALTN